MKSILLPNRAPIALVPLLVAVFAVGCPPGDVAEGEGEEGEGEEGEGEGEEGEGEEGEGEGEGEAVILSEVGCSDDFVEVLNVSSAAVSLATFTVSDDVNANPPRREPLSGVLEPGARASVSVTAFGVACDDTITLLDNNRIVDATTLAVAIDGASWSRVPEPISAASAFAESFATRDLPNQPFAVGDVRLNEIDCRGVERVELINNGAAPVDVGGFVLTTSPGDPDASFTLPAFSLAPGAFLVIAELAPPVDGFPFSIACNGETVQLLDGSGAVADSVRTDDTAEAFTYGRLPDGVGAFVATEETIGAANRAPEELGVGVFDAARVAVVDVDATGVLGATPVPCTFTFDADAVLACEVTQLAPGRLFVQFDAAARFRGLEDLIVDTSGVDPSHARAAVASALYRALSVVAPRVGLARVTVDGAAAQNAVLVEVLQGRGLARAFTSTNHLYRPRIAADLVSAQLANYDVVVGDAAAVDDLDGIATVLAPFQDTAGFRAGGGSVMKIGDTLRFLAVEAWLAGGAGYARTRTGYGVHVDDAGEATLLPDYASGGMADALGADGALAPAGSLVVDACNVDPDCRAEFFSFVSDVNDAVVLDGVLDDVTAGVRAAFGANADAAALDAVDDRLDDRSFEVEARLP